MGQFVLWTLKPRPNDRNMPTQHIATLLGATCCMRLATVLRNVARCWVLLAQIWPFSNLSQQHPTCRNTVAKRSQYVAPNNVATCCVGMLRSFGRGLSFHSTRSDARVRFDSGAIFLDQSQFFATHIATDEIASFCINHRSRQMSQMAFFRAKAGQRRAGAKGRLSRYVETFWNKKGFSLLYKTNRFHVAVRLIQW